MDGPPKGAPSAHDARYDRQLRLWASSGQQALESAHVLIVGASPAACQTAKNLALPGIGAITILDDSMVEVSDIGKNFFLTTSSLGKEKAPEVLQYILELNDSVKGFSIEKTVQTVFEDNPTFLSPYSLVLVFDQSPQNTNLLATRCWQADIPLITVRTSGFYAYVRAQYKEITLVETHPETVHDLRLDCPFQALTQYASSVNFDTLDSYEHTHLPAILIILKALQIYSQAHNNKAPKSHADKDKLKNEIIPSLRRFDNDENFQEAVSLLNRVYRETRIPSDITQLLDDEQCAKLSNQSTPFWIHMKALKAFVQSSPDYNQERFLPLPGSLPDMKATSSGYHQLATIYRNKATEDVEYFRLLLLNELTRLYPHVKSQEELENLPGFKLQDTVTFVKHAAYLKVLRGQMIRSGETIAETWLSNMEADELKGRLEIADGEQPGPPIDLLSMYFSMLVEDTFMAKYGRRPALSGTRPITDGSASNGDMTEMCELARNTLGDSGVQLESLPVTLMGSLREIVRAKGAELPAMSAWVGGIVAQESIKIVTRQYVPINGSLFIDGIGSRTGIF